MRAIGATAAKIAAFRAEGIVIVIIVVVVAAIHAVPVAVIIPIPVLVAANIFCANFLPGRD